MATSRAKYRQIIDAMFAEHADLFAQFHPIHDEYAKNPKKFQATFNVVGADVMDILRDAERKLCHGMERGQFANYSSKLADQYWTEIRTHFPLIDQVGIVIE